MADPQTTTNEGEQSLLKTVNKIIQISDNLESNGRKMRNYHQIFTILTILLGVSAPAVVTLIISYPGIKWAAIIITAVATASATIRSVLRYNERYSNSALTSLSLSHLEKQVQARQYEIKRYKEEFRQEEFFKLAGWADEEMYKIKKAYVEQDVSAITQETIKLSTLPSLDESKKMDSKLQSK